LASENWRVGAASAMVCHFFFRGESFGGAGGGGDASRRDGRVGYQR
jgi:hypothetical protein